MKIENIDTTLEEIQEVGEQMRVINEAISQPVGGFQVGGWEGHTHACWTRVGTTPVAVCLAGCLCAAHWPC